MVLIAYSILVARNSTHFQSYVVATFGLVLTLVWAYAAHRSYGNVKYLTEDAAEKDPAYKSIFEDRPKRRILGAWPVMTYSVPIAAIGMWAVLLAS